MNDLFFSDEHLMLRDMVREFAANEVAPVAAELEHEAIFRREIIEKLVELALMGIPIPEEYGGAGMVVVAYITAVY